MIKKLNILFILYSIICLTYGLNNNHKRGSQQLLQPSDENKMRFAESELGWIEKLKAKKSSSNKNNNNAPAPATNAPAPATNAPAPATNAPAPAPVPKNNKGTSSSTSTSAPAPVTNAPAPAPKNNKGNSPSTSTSAPAPVTNAPAPAPKNNKGSSPSTSTSAPAPVTNAPAPAPKNNKGSSPSTSTSAPAPVTNAPAPAPKNNKGSSPSTSTSAPAPVTKNNKGSSPSTSTSAPDSSAAKKGKASTDSSATKGKASTDSSATKGKASTDSSAAKKGKASTDSSATKGKASTDSSATKGKASTDSSAAKKGKASTDSSAAKKGKASTDSSAAKKGKASTDSSAAKGKGKASTDSSAAKGKGKASTDSSAAKGKGKASTDSSAKKGKGKASTDSSAKKGKGKASTDSSAKKTETKTNQQTQQPKAQPATPAASAKPVFREFRILKPFDKNQIDKTKADLQKSLCDALGPEKCAGVRIVSLASGSILVMCEFSQAGSVTSNNLAQDVINMVVDDKSKLRTMPLWADVDPKYIKDPNAPPTTSKPPTKESASNNRGPVPVQNAARDDKKSRGALEKMKASPQDVGGSCKINRIVEMGEAVCQQLLCVDATVQSNMECNILSSRLGRAETIASDMVVTGALSAPSGTLIINSELMMTQTDFSATSFIAENIVIDGVKQWKLIHHDDFEQNAEGWSLLETSSCTGRDHFLGGHCKLGTGKVTKTYDKLPPHKQVRVTARYHFIDKWNGETAFLEMDNNYSWVHRHKTSSQGINMCGGNYPEEKMSTPIDVVQAHSESFLQLSFGSSGNPDQNPCERSFGVDDVMVYVR